MSEQARKVKHEAIPQWAEGLYYNKGLFSEVLVYHDEIRLSTSSIGARTAAHSALLFRDNQLGQVAALS
jgi:hypothetical protein